MVLFVYVYGVEVLHICCEPMAVIHVLTKGRCVQCASTLWSTSVFLCVQATVHSRRKTELGFLAAVSCQQVKIVNGLYGNKQPEFSSPF